jgi:mannosyltransferase
MQPTRSPVLARPLLVAEPESSSRRWLVGAGLEALLAFVLAMFRIDARSIWYDEAVSVLASGSSLGELERVARTFDPNMSGYHALLGVWQRAFGSSETALRSLSAVAVAMAVVVVVALGRRIHDTRTGLIAGLVLAVSPFVVRYGQEARSYALEVLVVTTATYLFVLVIDDDRTSPAWWPALAYGVVAAFACYVHLYSVFVLAAHAVSLAFVAPARIPWTQLLRSARVASLLLVPMLFWLASGPSEHLQWIPRPEPGDLLVVARDISGGGAVALVLGGLVVLRVVGSARAFARSGRSRAAWTDGLALSWLLVPFALSALVSFTVKPIFLDRYLIVCVPAVALLAATALARLRFRPVAAAALAVVVIGSLVTISRSYGGHRTNWRDAVAYVSGHASTADGIVVCPPRARLPVTYYVTRTVPQVIRPISLSPADHWEAGFRVHGVDGTVAATWREGGPERIWVLGRAERCGFTFPDRDHNVSLAFTKMTVERYDRR